MADEAVRIAGHAHLVRQGRPESCLQQRETPAVVAVAILLRGALALASLARLQTLLHDSLCAGTTGRLQHFPSGCLDRISWFNIDALRTHQNRPPEIGDAVEFPAIPAAGNAVPAGPGHDTCEISEFSSMKRDIPALAPGHRARGPQALRRHPDIDHPRLSGPLARDIAPSTEPSLKLAPGRTRLPAPTLE